MIDSIINHEGPLLRTILKIWYNLRISTKWSNA